MKHCTDRSINHNKSYTVLVVFETSLNSEAFLGYCAMVFGFHVLDDFIPEKFAWEIFVGMYFHILTQYKPIVERISACQGIPIRIIIIYKEVGKFFWWILLLLLLSLLLLLLL